MMQQMRIPAQPGKLTPESRVVKSSNRLGRILKVIYILYCIEAGIFLLWLPWLSIWDANFFTFIYPQILPVITNSFLKGAVLGLGIVNIMIGIHEVVHFKQVSKGAF
jgi:hypothetical protein